MVSDSFDPLSLSSSPSLISLFKFPSTSDNSLSSFSSSPISILHHFNVNEQPDDEIEEDDIIECKERLRKFVEEKLNEYGEPIKFGRTKIIKEYFSNIKANYLAKLKYDAPLASYIIDLDDKYLVKDNFQIKLEHYKNHILSKFNTTINIKIIKFLEELSSEKTTNEVRKINYIEFYKLVSKLGKLALLDSLKFVEKKPVEMIVDCTKDSNDLL
ncbi:7842_t:CDS:2 [Entrophospora sp. SA101]|nr:7842_t:CDS:2 [Entrophospora sp. SA101]